MKICPRCKKEKPLSQFPKDSARKSGVYPVCRECKKDDGLRWRQNNPEYGNNWRNDFKNKNPEKYKASRDEYNKGPKGKDSQLRREYGITLEEYNKILERQNFACAACKVNLLELKTKNVHVDHDHSTGVVRGILYQGCNVALGLVRDSVERLHGLITYLEGHNDALPQ